MVFTVDAEALEDSPTDIDYLVCFQYLVANDEDKDDLLGAAEYLHFIQDYARRQKCINNPVLTVNQRIAFNTIVCDCQSEDLDCCIDDTAAIRIAGALNPNRPDAQTEYLSLACSITDDVLGPSQCNQFPVEEETVIDEDEVKGKDSVLPMGVWIALGVATGVILLAVAAFFGYAAARSR